MLREPDINSGPRWRGRRSDSDADHALGAYCAAICGGDPNAAAAVIDRAIADGLSAVEIQSRVITPAMREVGCLWERAELSVAQEHLATAISHQVLARLYSGLLDQAERRSDTAVVAGVQGEHHVLGLRMVADVLEGAGFVVLFLGADVPESSLLAMVAEHQPALLALGVTMPLAASTLLHELEALRAGNPELKVAVGGQGVPASLRACPGVYYAADTEQLAYCADRVREMSPLRELPHDIARSGVTFGPGEEEASHVIGGLEAQFAHATAAAADAARGYARRAFALEQIAFRDPLTELWNRRAFDDRYQSLTEGEIMPAPTILMLDVDRFKSINDTYGHEAGDRALIGVARCIALAIRADDFAARLGGDEFVVLMPDTAAHEAAEIGERIRHRIEAELTDPQITVSIGVSVPDHTNRRRATLDVDRALYQAKEHGRNQVAFA